MTTLATADRRFVFSNPIHFLAFGFGSGLLKPGPGTWGTLVALPLAALWCVAGLPMPWLAWLCILLFFVGIPICGITGRALGVHDYGGIVFDEIVAMLALLALVPGGWLSWLLAFGLFRLFDILKPWPIRWLDAKVQGGFGVMLDDALAGVFAGGAFWLVWNVIG